MLKVYEARLTEEETVCLDLDKVEAYRCGLKVRRILGPSLPCLGLGETYGGGRGLEVGQKYTQEPFIYCVFCSIRYI